MNIKAISSAAFLILGIVAAQAPAQSRGPIDLPIEMEVRIAPIPFKADAKTHLVYELHLTNFSSRELTLSRVEVIAGSDGKALAQYEGTELNAKLANLAS